MFVVAVFNSSRCYDTYINNTQELITATVVRVVAIGVVVVSGVFDVAVLIVIVTAVVILVVAILYIAFVFAFTFLVFLPTCNQNNLLLYVIEGNWPRATKIPKR